MPSLCKPAPGEPLVLHRWYSPRGASGPDQGACIFATNALIGLLGDADILLLLMNKRWRPTFAHMTQDLQGKVKAMW